MPLTVCSPPWVIPPFLVGFISRLVFKRRVSCAAQVFGRGLFACRHVRALVIVSPELLRCGVLGFPDAHKHVLIQPIVAHCSVIAFHIGILLRGITILF